MEMAKRDDDYFLTLVENFEKFLEERRYKVRQEMMKCRIDMETEFKLQLKRSAFQSMMNLRQKVNESNKRLKGIFKENDRKIYQRKETQHSRSATEGYWQEAQIADNATLKNNRSGIEKRMEMRRKETRNMETRMDEENSRSNEAMKKWYSGSIFESQGDKGWETLDSSNGINSNCREENCDISRTVSSKNENLDIKHEHVIDPRFLEMNVNSIHQDKWIHASYLESSSLDSNENILISDYESEMTKLLQDRSRSSNDGLNSKTKTLESGTCEGATKTKDWDDDVEKEKVEGVEKTTEPEGTIEPEETIGSEGTIESEGIIELEGTIESEGIIESEGTAESEGITESEGKIEANIRVSAIAPDISMLTSSAESANSETEISFPFIEGGDLPSLPSLIARHLEPCEGEDSRKHYDVKRTHELTHATGSSLNSKTGLRGKDNSKKYENNRGFAISNVPTFGFSPRSPSKYRKFKSDREIRRNTLKENALENEKKLLNEFD